MKKKVKSKFALECLDCGEPYKAADEFVHCPLCGGIGELSVANYEDSGWGSDSDFQEDISDFSDMDSLVFDPDIYND
jgi:hypothetical protein